MKVTNRLAGRQGDRRSHPSLSLEPSANRKGSQGEDTEQERNFLLLALRMKGAIWKEPESCLQEPRATAGTAAGRGDLSPRGTGDWLLSTASMSWDTERSPQPPDENALS